ncbi:CIA30 domain-containing protein [Aphelenchoides fujianensis]|nr:CIA30 domain-containing protein [Aphelenchoides fujianensis]
MIPRAAASCSRQAPFSRLFERSASAYTPSKPAGKRKEEVEAARPSRLTERIRRAILGKRKDQGIFGGRSDAPMNWNYPNPRFLDDYDPEVTLQDARDAMPGMIKENIKLVKEEFNDTFKMDNPVGDSILGPVQNQLHIEYDFKSEEQMKRWATGCDADWGEGYSKCELKRTENNSALFSGFIDSRLIKDGRIERAGWASMKTHDRAAFNRKRYLFHWTNYNHLMIKCRGDGRSYKVMLYTPHYVDLSWGDTYSFHLHTHGGPYWQYERIPFSRFIHTVGGRVQDRQRKLMANEISNIGITLMDRIDGPFRLEVEFIGVIKDWKHDEKLAYEQYSIPHYHPEAM